MQEEEVSDQFSVLFRQNVSERVREKDDEKSRQAVEVFAPQTFSYAVAIDTAADVYNGVCLAFPIRNDL